MCNAEQEYETEAEMEAMGLDGEEKDILRSFNRGEWQPVSLSDAQREGYMETARNTLAILSQDHDVTVTISGRDLIGLRGKAFEQGIHYKTLIATVLHKYSTGKLVERDVQQER